MEHVEVFLKHIGLGQCVQVFEENAYDSLEIFFVMDETDFKIFGPHVGMKPGHLLRLQKTVFRMKRKCVSQRETRDRHYWENGRYVRES